MRPLKRFVPLDKNRHDRKLFDCAKPPLNEFLAHQACRGMDARASHTWVLPAAGTPKGGKKPICAYYTLNVCHIERTNLPDDLARRMPRYPLPAFLLAQLAVDRRCQGMGLGTVTLINALRRCARLSRGGEVPAIAVVLDVVDDKALAFYRRFEAFRELPQPGPGGKPRLYIPMRVVERL